MSTLENLRSKIDVEYFNSKINAKFLQDFKILTCRGCNGIRFTRNMHTCKKPKEDMIVKLRDEEIEKRLESAKISLTEDELIMLKEWKQF